MRYTQLALNLSICTGLLAQSPIPPPVVTDFNVGVPGTWEIETLGSTGWLWSSNAGYGASGGLMMDCGACAGYEETTIWSPWLDLSNDPQIDVHFRCAIIGGGMMVPPPIFVRRDGVGGPTYEYRYGYPDLIPPPDEVIPSTIDAFPPLDPEQVLWVDITFPFYAGLNADSVRIGIATGVPLGGYALVDDIGIGGLPTSTATAEAPVPIVMRQGDLLTLRSTRPIDRWELLDASGRELIGARIHSGNEVNISMAGLAHSLYLVRIWQNAAPTVIRVQY